MKRFAENWGQGGGGGRLAAASVVVSHDDGSMGGGRHQFRLEEGGCKKGVSYKLRPTL